LILFLNLLRFSSSLLLNKFVFFFFKVFILFFAVGFGIWCPTRSTSAVLPTSLRFGQTEDVTLNASPASDYFTPNSMMKLIDSFIFHKYC
jgi:hypothetical protein